MINFIAIPSIYVINNDATKSIIVMENWFQGIRNVLGRYDRTHPEDNGHDNGTKEKNTGNQEVSKDLTPEQNRTSKLTTSHRREIPPGGVQSADRCVGNDGQVLQDDDPLVHDPDAIVTLGETLNSLPNLYARALHHRSPTLTVNRPNRNTNGRCRKRDGQHRIRIKDLTPEQNRTSNLTTSQIRQIPPDGVQSAERAVRNDGQVRQDNGPLVNDPDAIVTLDEMLNSLPNLNATAIYHHSSSLIVNRPNRNANSRRRNRDRRHRIRINTDGPHAMDVEDGATARVEVHDRPIDVPIIVITAAE